MEALIELGGKGTLLDVAKIIWKNHKIDLENSGNLFYSWQYDYRWAATYLREKGVMKSVQESEKGIWELK